MATALQTPLSKIECSLDMLECSICTHRFMQPKWLSCFHTFCLKCLQELRESGGPQCWKLTCPLCGCETVLNNREVSDLPDNNEMMTIVEELTKQEQIITGKLSELEDFQKLVVPARRSETAFAVAAKDIDSTLEKLGNVFADTKKKISRKANIAVTRIRREEQALKQEAEKVYEDKVKTLNNVKASNKKKAFDAAYHLDRINQHMEGANGHKGTDFKKRLCNDLEEVTRKQPEVVQDSLAFMGFNESDIGSHGKVVLNFQQPPPNFGQGAPGGRRSSKEPKKFIQRATQPPKLNTAGEKAWKPDKDVPEDVDEAKMFDSMKKMKSLLNKLTPNNFSKLKDQALRYAIDTEDRLKSVIDLVFENAISEQSFSRTYAQLCRDLSQLKVQMSSGQGIVQFLTLLINRCQKEFEKEKNDEKEEKEEREAISKRPVDQRTAALEELELKLIKNKRRILGNIRFIGELFKLQMLIEQIMHDCIFKLLCSKDEESLECMSHLMSTIGKILDHEKAKNRMDQYFTQMKSIIDQKKTSARIRFMLQDVLDLRLHRKWIPRRDTDNPKTIEQIHQDFKRDEERKKMEGFQAQMTAPQSRMSRNKRDQPQRVGPPQPEGWSTVTSTKATRVAVDPNKFKVMKQQSIDDDIQLGPGPRSFGGWSRGSSKGSSKTQSENPEPKQSNRYMMLSDERRGRGPVQDTKSRGPQSLSKRSSGSRERDEMSKERRSAIAGVQRISGSRRSQSREKELDSRRGKPEPASVSAPAKEQTKPTASPALKEDVFEKKAQATIEEYLNIKDIKYPREQVIQQLAHLNQPSQQQKQTANAPVEDEAKPTPVESAAPEEKSQSTQEVSEKIEAPAVVPSGEQLTKETEQKDVVLDDNKDKQEQEKVESENAKNKEEATDEDPKASLKDNKIQLKYTYREDHWSPANPEGKKQYGRDFLLQFQPDCKDKPEGLPHIPDIVLEKQSRHPGPAPLLSSGIPTGASPSPSSSPGVVNNQGLATGTAHDMSKQGAPSCPGLAPFPQQQGNVVQQQQQQPPQGMILQQPYYKPQARGAQVYMPRMNSQQNPRGGIQIQAPTSGPQQMTAGSQMNALNQFMLNQQFVIPMMQQPLNMSQYPREQVIQQQAHLNQPSQQQFQPRQVYQQFSQNLLGQGYTQPSTPPYYTNSPPVNLKQGGDTFFQGNQAGMVLSQQQMRPQTYQATLPQAPQYTAPPKKKNIIRIVDTKSNQDITDMIIREATMTTGSSSPHSGQSSASGTPPASQTPPQNYQANEKRAAIQASFAAQVARLAHTPEAQGATTDQMPVVPPQNPLPESGLPKEPIAGAPPAVSLGSELFCQA